MKNTDKFILTILMLGAFWLLFSTNITEKPNVSPDNLIKKLIQNTRYLTPEEVAEMIISGDPSLQLIDVRSDKYYNKFTLKGAINAPMKDFLNEENLANLDQEVYKTVLFSNGTSDADVAWVLANRLGYKNVYVMKGGLNRWVENILQPQDKSVIWDRIDDEIYQYRRGASQFFGGKSSAPAGGDDAVAKPKKKIKRHKKKEVENYKHTYSSLQL